MGDQLEGGVMTTRCEEVPVVVIHLESKEQQDEARRAQETREKAEEEIASFLLMIRENAADHHG